MNWTNEEALVAEIWHTGFRKALDSTASAICWNAIHLLDNDEWREIIQQVTRVMKSNEPLVRENMAIQKGKTTAGNLLAIGLDMMTEAEFEALSSWCYDRFRQG